MVLYGHELYKICCRKSFAIGLICVFLMTTVQVWGSDLAVEKSHVEGAAYTGLQAVWADRQLARAYEGELTDEKVADIVERYGLSFEEKNYLTEFIIDYLTDGYHFSQKEWETVRGMGTVSLVRAQFPALIKPLSETAFGAVQEDGGEVWFAYTTGWTMFREMVQWGFLAACVLLVLCLSRLFAEEKQVKVQALLFTAKEGKEKDFAAKLLAGFTVMAGLYLFVVATAFLVTAAVYGTSGLRCLASFLRFEENKAMAYGMTIASYLGRYLLFGFFGMLCHAAFVMSLSARMGNTLHVAVASLSALVFPAFVAMMASGLLWRLCCCTPFMIIQYGFLFDVSAVWSFAAVVFSFGVVFALTGGRRRWLEIG